MITVFKEKRKEILEPRWGYMEEPRPQNMKGVGFLQYDGNESTLPLPTGSCASVKMHMHTYGELEMHLQHRYTIRETAN